MRQLKIFLWSFVLFSGLQEALGAPRNPLKDPRKCGRPECDIENKKFGYKSSVRYKYNYDMHIRSEFSGSGDNTSDLYFFASVDLTFPKECEGILSLSKIEVRETVQQESVVEEGDYFNEYDYTEEDTNLHGKNRELAEALQKYDLRFAFHDGVVGEVCPNDEEPVWVLNFKKGILSAFQNSMLRFDVDFNTTETDVSGTCNVVYNLHEASGTSVIIQKVKNIDSCTSRYKMQSILQTTPYNFRDNKAIWPILQSQSHCNLSVDHHVYKAINCYERHLLVPFSNNQSGAVTESHMKLTLIDESTYDQSYYYDMNEDIVTKRSSLLFDHTPTFKPTHGEIKASRELVAAMCRQGFPNIQRGFIENFTKFLNTVRLLSYTALHQLLARASSICANGKNHVLESLPYIGSAASVQIMRDQMVGEAVSKSMAQNWMGSLSFMSRPSKEMLEAFYALISYGQRKNYPEYILGSTAVIHTFCRQNTNCEEYEEVRNIIKLLEYEFLNNFKENTDDRRIKEKLVVLLKGLGNIGIMSDAFVYRLQQIIPNDSVNIEIRIQAILSFRRLDCGKHRNFFLEIYQNFIANSELRILSYVQSMRCPDYTSIHRIKQVLEVEEVNQVGSYVWSHLTNLAKSSSPVRVEAQGLLVDGDLGTKYNMDVRKFSRNFEHSIFFDEYNIGTATDANIIFGTDSYLPRIVSLNFTADLFGESVNFFELSTRIQGFEQLVASIFGPKGPLNAESFRKKFPFLNTILGDDSEEQEDDFINFDKLRLRRNLKAQLHSESDAKRSPRNDVTDLQNSVDNLGYKLKYNYNEPRAIVGLKVFGNDIKYYTLEGLMEVMSAKEVFNPVAQLAKLLSGEEITFSKSGVFLDASYNVPLSSGLPLSIHAHGASSIDIRMSGNFETSDSPKEEFSLDIEGRLKPSISADVMTTMETDFFYATSGIRVKSNLYSSSSVEAKLKIRGARLISLHISLPQDRNDIFSARSELLVIKETEEIEQRGISKRYSNETCTWPLIDRAVGLKVCSEYSLPDISNQSANYPGLILSGPIIVDVHLDKADLTAKTFVFEYRWNQSGNFSNGSFVFETPGSEIPRVLTANITRDLESANVSMSFRNGENSHAAVGTYNGNPDDRRLELYFDTNGKKNLAFEMSMNRSESKNGWIYYPKVLLSVNDDRIAGMVGTVKVTEKKGIKQNDINLSFETKKLQLRLVGSVIKTEVSYSMQLKTDYRFQTNKIESVELEGEIADRSQKSKTEYKGFFKLLSTAYPNLNFASNLTWLSLLGHSEGKLTYNNAPDLLDPQYTTATRIIFARQDTDDKKSEGYRTTASLEVTRPVSKIDFRLLFKHEERYKNGPVHNFLAALRYAPKKEATAVFSVFFPRRHLFAFDASMNITVPAFDSCAARLFLIEREQKDYSIDFNGTWFSGHTIAVKGSYQDKSSRIRSHHHLKLLVKSPSFEDTAINVVYRKNELEILFDVQAEYDQQPYGFMIKYSVRDDEQRNTYAEIKIRDKIYWVSSKMLAKDSKLLFIEIHVDKLRDIHLKISGMSTEIRKEASFEIKWDANRDPSQRLALLAEFKNPEVKKYDGTLMLTYPERTFSCAFDADMVGPNYRGTGRVSWSANEAITLRYDAGALLEDDKNIWINADLHTPFEGWGNNALKGAFYYLENLLLINGSLLWADNQNIGLVFKGDYKIDDPVLECEVKLEVNSTIQDVPTARVYFKHSHDLRKFDTDIDLRYKLYNESNQIYSVRSLWKLDKDYSHINVSGAVKIKSPFEGYKIGGMITKFSLSDQRKVYGAATLKLEDRKFNLALVGHIRKLTDNKLQINITTPLEKFKTITARFGINEKERHVVAEVRAPAGALGIEVLFMVHSFSNFDVKFSLATPIESFERIELISKLKPDTFDMRGGWNKVNLGFTGVWRMFNLTDFEYSYRVLTPLPSFEDNGIVVKFVYVEEFNFEMYVKFSKYKLGAYLHGKPKPKLIAQLRSRELEIDLLEEDEEQYLQPTNNNSDDSDESSSSEEDNEDNYEDLLNYIGYMEVDILVWPTIKGTIDIEEIEDYYITIGKLELKQGTIDIKDRLYYPDLLNVKNFLRIHTPFSIFESIKSKFEYSMEPGQHYITGLEISVFDNKTWKDIGYFANYSIATDDSESKIHDVAIVLKTPLEVLKKIDLKGSLELEDSIYRGNFTAQTGHTRLSVAGLLESDENFVDASLGLNLETAVIPHYACRIYFKKDFSEVENSIDLGFDVHDNGTSNKLRVEAMWHMDQSDYINAKTRIHTNILPLKLAESSIIITKIPNPLAFVEVSFVDKYEQRTEFRARAIRKKEIVTLELVTPIKEYRNITMRGILTSVRSDTYNINGNMYRNSIEYALDGVVTFDSDLPVQGSLRLKPKAGGPEGRVQISVNNTEGNYGKTFQVTAVEGRKTCQVAGGYSLRSRIDWDCAFAITSTEQEISNINLNAKVYPQDNGRLLGRIDLATPWKHLGIETVKLGTDLSLKPKLGEIRGDYELATIKGSVSCSWSWIILENMQFIIESQIHKHGFKPRIVQANAKYINPSKRFQHLTASAQLNVDSLWILEVNGTAAYISSNDISGGLITRLPAPVGDVHRVSARYRGNLVEQKDPPDVSVELKYESDEAKKRFTTRAQYRNANDIQGSARVEWGPDAVTDALEGDVQMLRKGPIRKEFTVKLRTPYFTEESLFVNGNYDQQDIYHLLACDVNFPASRKVADTDIRFSTLANMKGYLNSTTPFLNITWLKADFDFSTVGGKTQRYIKAMWPKDFAFFDLRSTYSSEKLNRDLQGVIKMEVPLTSRHFANINYDLKERPHITTGNTNIVYNGKNVLNGKYTAKLESRSGFEKDVVDISLENEFKPLGIHYIHSRQYTNAENPDYDMKHIELFELRNSAVINITGEVHVKTTYTGQDYKFIAIHPNRTVILSSDYDYEDITTKQKAKLELSPNAWIGYYVEVKNLTKEENDSQSFVLDIFYPKRKLSAEGWYSVTDIEFDSDVAFKWTTSKKNSYYDDKPEDEPRIMRAGLQWRSEPVSGFDKDNQTAIVTLKHPLLQKDITIKGYYYRSLVHLFKTKIIFNYTNDPTDLITLGAEVKDVTSIVGYRNYTFDIFGKHNISNFDLAVNGSMALKLMHYEAKSRAYYKRGYLPLQEGLFLSLIDLNNRIIHYHRESPYKAARLWAQTYGSFPVYGFNATIWDSPDVNSTGYFFVNIKDKYTRMEFNMTPDASHNLQMVGLIPDARSAYFDIWRNYEEIRVIDVASYLKMNHSRLVTSQLHWRPKIKNEVKNKLRGLAASFYESLSNGIDFWIKTVYSESVDTVGDIWKNAKPHTQQFLDDMSGLNVLENDFEELRTFMNKSYEANDFYIKTAINFTLTVIDELAIRDHIESLPKIFTEIWQVMGDSGKALRKSILWLFETIKTSYHKALDIISKFLHGESLEQLSSLMEKAIEKYDKFVKGLHLSLIKYVENLWSKFSSTVSNYWKITLHRIEPHVMRFLHYIESAIWNISKEVFDFIYERTNELVESPYFNQVSSFTQDLDRLYRDLMANDAITNFKKYGAIAWEFIKEKYFKLVPFGKELNDVLTELWEEIKALQENESVQIIMQYFNEIQVNMEWIANEFQLEKRLHQLWSLVRNKISSITQTALQADNRYREAKTKFIFDPDTGVMDLEQKLPMSWHAFNETPQFEEIPEYKLLIDIRNFFSETNFTLWNYMYDLRAHMDPKTWFPPYKAHSLLIGSRHYMTFDKKFVGLDLRYETLSRNSRKDQCSYLLAQDFFNKNFTLILEPSTIIRNDKIISTRKYTLLTDSHLLEVDVAGDTLRIGRNITSTLPVQIGDAIISRDSDVLVIESSQDFVLNCNLQFDLCWFELGGWYYGQTAGILGTMNNEEFDDFKTSKYEIVKNEEQFVNSWKLGNCNKDTKWDNKVNDSYSSELMDICSEFFKSPYFSNCFSALDPTSFYDMCLDMGYNSISTVLKDNHPAYKGACTAALAYIEGCNALKIPLRIPDKCVHCDLINGSYVSEGTFVHLENNDIPRTSDIVFLVEAKDCNHNMSVDKSIMTVVNSLNKELVDANVTNNRYSVLVFGGRAPFDKPRSIVHSNQVFTDANNLRHYFDHIQTMNGSNNDIFEAISVASKLVFRPGASKTFILLPCSECLSSDMRFDYSSLLQLLLEEGINLHILMDKEFVFDKARLTRIFFGMDREYAYSKRDLKDFKGDAELRKQVRLPKEDLGLCTPLAIETNGSVFTARKLRPEKRNPVKKFASIFAKRVAKTAVPDSCQTCECTGHNTGVAYMTCTSCSIPSPSLIEYDFDETGNDFNWDWDEDDEMI